MEILVLVLVVPDEALESKFGYDDRSGEAKDVYDCVEI